jgi:hypothetical protein
VSLINEALKKARLESARKQDSRHGLLAPSHIRQRRSVWPWIVTAGSLSLAIGVIVGVVLRSGGDGPTSGSVMAPAEQSMPVAATEPSTAQQRVDSQVEVRQPVPARQEAEPVSIVAAPSQPVSPEIVETPEVELAPTEPRPDPKPDREEKTDLPSSAPSLPSEVPGQVTTPDPGPQDGESFLRRVPLPGGQKIVLNGIAWSESGPVALLNGRALEHGEYVDGWKLSLIERELVVLEKDDVTIRVRLK